MKRYDNRTRLWHKFYVYALTLFIMGCEGKEVASSLNQKINQHPTANEEFSEDSLKVSEAVEDFEDFSATSSVIDRTFTSAIENAIISNLEREAKASGSPDNIGFTASTMRFSDSGKNLMVTEFFLPGAELGTRESAHMTVIWWVSEGSLKRVYCADTAGRKIDWRKGACGRQVAKTFNFNDWLIDSEFR